MRKITSLTASLSFILLVLPSIILYVVPYGRVASWVDWRLWGLTKTEWENTHIDIGLFLLAVSVHVCYNWKAILNYLKNRTRQFKVFTREFNTSLALSIPFILGTYFEMTRLDVDLWNKVKK